jgi:ketosteroid isomerase-like protein
VSQENVESFRRASEAFNDGDLDAFLAFFDTEVAASPRLAPIEGVYRGHDGVGLWWETLRGTFPDFHSEVVAVRDLGNLTLAELHNRGRGVESETPVEQTSWHVTEWRAGKIVRWTTYGSEPEALQAVGLAE